MGVNMFSILMIGSYDIPIGLHANLSEGVPVCAALRRSSSLLNLRGVLRGKAGFREALKAGQLCMAEVPLDTHTHYIYIYIYLV